VSNAFVPGAIADSLTSYAGVIYGYNDQTTLLVFLNAGACGSYGTLPSRAPTCKNSLRRRIYFYQYRGFSLAECYYM